MLGRLGARAEDPIHRAAVGTEDRPEGEPDEHLLELERSIETTSEPLKTFYKTATNYIIQGYTNSSYFMTEVKPYKLVPGPVYKGCVPLSE